MSIDRVTLERKAKEIEADLTRVLNERDRARKTVQDAQNRALQLGGALMMVRELLEGLDAQGETPKPGTVDFMDEVVPVESQG